MESTPDKVSLNPHLQHIPDDEYGASPDFRRRVEFGGATESGDDLEERISGDGEPCFFQRLAQSGERTGPDVRVVVANAVEQSVEKQGKISGSHVTELAACSDQWEKNNGSRLVEEIAQRGEGH